MFLGSDVCPSKHGLELFSCAAQGEILILFVKESEDKNLNIQMVITLPVVKQKMFNELEPVKNV